jgi:putative transcriptional regulator
LLRKAVEGGEESVKRALMNTIAGEVVFSKRPGDVLRKWRLLFEQSQKNLAKAMGVASSVLSDYENSRRKSPGTDFIRRYVTALIELDVARGRPPPCGGSPGLLKTCQASFWGMAEYARPRTMDEVARALKGCLACGESDDGPARIRLHRGRQHKGRDKPRVIRLPQASGGATQCV